MSCTGECCMYLGFDRAPDEWAGQVNDGDIVAAMLIPMSKAEVVEYRDYFYPAQGHKRIGAFGTVPGDTEHYYLCRHWNEDTRRCNAYETRPQVCRDYPYEKECVHCGFVETPDVVERWLAIRARPQKRRRGMRSAQSKRRAERAMDHGPRA